MLDRLPPELRDHVLDLLPPAFHLDELRERRSAMYVCCLINKRVSSRATPLLYRDVLLDVAFRFRGFLRRLQRDPAVGERSRSLVIERHTMEGDWDHTGLISSMLQRLPSVRRLHWIPDPYGSVDLSPIQEHLKTLEELHLDYPSLHRLPSALTLSSLVSLSLNQTTMSLAAAQSLAIPITLPAPQAFAFTAERYNEDNVAVVKHMVGAFAGRLEVLQLHLEDRYMMPNLVLPILDSIVLTTGVGNLDPGPPGLNSLRPPSLRLYLQDVPDLDDCEMITNEFSIDRPFLRRVYLPILLRPSSLGPEQEELLEPLNLLLGRLEAAKIDIHWYDSQAEEQYAVSPSFWRDAKVRKEQWRIEESA